MCRQSVSCGSPVRFTDRPSVTFALSVRFHVVSTVHRVSNIVVSSAFQVIPISVISTPRYGLPPLSTIVITIAVITTTTLSLHKPHVRSNVVVETGLMFINM